MSRKYFGTDGIRGTANTPPMTPEIAMRLGMAAGKHFRRGGARRHTAEVGKDTRLYGNKIDALSSRRSRRHDFGLAQRVS